MANMEQKAVIKKSQNKGIMNKMRDKMPIIIIFLIVAFLGTIIFEWGMNYLGMRGENIVFAKINGEVVTDKEFKTMLDRQIEGMRQQNGGKDVDDQTMEQLKEQVWNTMVSQKLLEQEIKRLKIQTTDQEILDWVYNRPETLPDWLKKFFTDSTNVFRTDMMFQTLQNKKPEIVQAWTQIEQDLKKQLEYDKIQSFVTSSVTVSEGEVLQKYKDDNIIAKFDYTFLDPATITDTSFNVCTNDELKKYYDENKIKFKQEEAVKMKYVVFPEFASYEDSASVKKLFETIILSGLKTNELQDSSLIKFVNENSSAAFSDQFQKPSAFQKNELNFLFTAKAGDVSPVIIDQDAYKAVRLLETKEGDETYVNAFHILLKVQGTDTAGAKKKAEDVIKRIKGGEDFKKVAAEVSEDPSAKQNNGDLGWFGKGAMVKEFEDASLNASVGAIVGPVKTSFGFHIIKVVDKSKKEFKVAEVKKPVAVSEMTRNNIRKVAKDFYTDLDNGGNIDTLAKLFNVLVQNTNEVGKDGMIPGAGQNKAILNFAFKSKINKVLEPVKIQGGFGVYKLIEKIPEGYKNFDSVKSSAIKPIVVMEKKMNYLMGVANEMKSKIMNGDIFGLKNTYGQYVYESADSVTVSKPFSKIGNDYSFSNVLFTMNNSDISAPIKGTKGVYIVKMINITPYADADYAAKREGIFKQLLQNKQGSMFQDWLTTLKNNADIVDNRNLFL